MKTPNFITLLFISMQIICLGINAQTGFDYFGETPPGATPQLFAHEILTQSTGLYAVTRIAFSPDGLECFFSGPIDATFNGTRMYYTHCINNVWTSNELVTFFPGYSCRQPYFSAGGDTLYFSSNKNSTSDIWMVVRTSQGWGTPQVLPSPINTASYEGMYAQTKDGTIYIESDRPGGKGLIDVWRISRSGSEQPEKIKNLGVPVNTSNDDNDPFVSPDGRYLIFGLNYNDLFITFNKGSGGWTMPLNLNQFYPGINTDEQEYAPVITADGRYLFFNRISDGGIFWVSTSNIDSLQNIHFPPYINRTIPDQVAMQDSLFNYQIPDSIFIDDNGNNTLTYSATFSNGDLLPSWLPFNPETRTLSGNIDSTGTLIIKVTATDTAKAKASAQFNIIITDNHPASISRIDKHNIFIYPNPTNSLVNITFGTTPPQKAIVEIYGLKGNLELSETFYNTAIINTDLAGLPAGLYVVKVYADEVSYQEKILKQ